jgi:hypothetical protein
MRIKNVHLAKRETKQLKKELIPIRKMYVAKKYGRIYV